MDLTTALIFMKNGNKVRRKTWRKSGSYWFYKDGKIFVQIPGYKAMDIIEMNNMKNHSFNCLLALSSNDWEVVDLSSVCKDSVSKETGKGLRFSDWDGDKPSECDTSYSKQREIYEKAFKDRYNSLLEKGKKDPYEKLQEEIRKEFNLPEKNDEIKVIDKKYSGHGLEKGQDTLSRMAKKYNLKRGKRAENGAIDDSFAPSDAELDRLEKELKARVAKLNAKNEKENQEAINKLSSLPIENLISTEECKEAIKKCNNNIKYPKDDDCRRDYTKELKEAAGKPRVIKHPKFMSLHGDLTPESKKQETSNDRLKEATKKTGFHRVAPDVKPSNDYTEEDFKYLYKLFECLYKDGTLEKITQDTLRQIEQDVLSAKKVLKEIMDKNKSSKD